MFLKKLRKIIKVLLRFELSRYLEFKSDTIIKIFTSIIYLIINVLFWALLFDIGYFIESWNYSDILIFIAFSELFFGLDGAIFSIVSRFWSYIIYGGLDVQLTRPFDPRIRIIVLNIDYMAVINAAVTFTVILIFANVPIKIINLLFGIIVVILSNIILALIRSTLSYSAFWLGRMEAVTELSDCMVMFNKYPLVIMPKAVKFAFKFALPFYFFSTFPAEIVTEKLNSGSLTICILGIVFNLVLWTLINKIVWKKGMSKYESYNG